MNVVNRLKVFFPEGKFIPAECPDIEDDCFEINDKVHIQLCMDNSFCAVYEKEEGIFVFYPNKTTLVELVGDVFDAISKVKS